MTGKIRTLEQKFIRGVLIFTLTTGALGQRGAFIPAATAAVTVTKLADTNDGRCDADCSLREAIAAAAPNGTIQFALGLTGTIALGSTLNIEKDVTILGPETQPVIISGNNSVRVFYVNAGVHFTMHNLTITKGSAKGKSGVLHPKTTEEFNGQNGLGGGLLNNGGFVTIIGCTFSGNNAIGGNGTRVLVTARGGKGGDGVGGALYSSGTLYLINCTFSKNRAAGGLGGEVDENAYSFNAGDGGNGFGGAIYTAHNIQVMNCTFFGNKAEGGPGGTQTSRPADSIRDSILLKLGIPSAASSPNGKKGEGKGNALYRPGAIFAKNALVINKIGAFIIKNSIIEGDASGSNCEGEIKSEGYNIDNGGSCRLQATGDRSNIDPGLDSLRNNGGPSDTHALRPGSPAIDGGNPAGCTDHKGNAILFDQRGYIRPAGNRCDIGALEASLQQ